MTRHYELLLVGQKSNLNGKFKLELIITKHLRSVVKEL